VISPVGITKLENCFNKTHRLLRRARQTKSLVDIENHRFARRAAKNAWYKAQNKFHKKLYKKTLGTGGRAKAYWKIFKLNFKENTVQNVPTLIDENGTAYTSDASKATVLNKYFGSKSTLNLFNEPALRTELHKLTEVTTCTINVSSSSVFYIIMSLDASKVTGPDGIGSNILKHCALNLYIPIKIIAQRSLDCGIFPSTWKLANVTPIYKKGERHEICNFRPISLLSNISKVIERVVYNHL